MSDIFESALAKARENDRRNIDATLPTRLTGGSGSKSGSGIFSSALAKARERDRAPKRQLSPSYAGAGGSGAIMSSGANGLEPSAESFGWTSAREAEGALGQWESDLRLMGTQLKNRSERLSSTEKRLAKMQAAASTQADIAAYNALVDEYNAELESYRELYDRFEKFASSYDRGYEAYRDILSHQYEAAERLNAEADAVDERNKEVQRLIGQYELALNGAGIAPEQSIEELRRELIGSFKGDALLVLQFEGIQLHDVARDHAQQKEERNDGERQREQRYADLCKEIAVFLKELAQGGEEAFPLRQGGRVCFHKRLPQARLG